MYSYGPLHMAELKQDNQLEHTYSSYVRIQDVAQKTCQRWWTIGKSGMKGSGRSVLAAWHDNNDVLEWFKKELEKEGYSITVKAMEIGARGFVAGTLYQFLGQIGINRCNRSKSMKRLTEITENCSMWIWNKRNVPWNISK